MKMVYLASPYSAHTPEGSRDDVVEHKRYLEACAATGLLMQKGQLVYSPIVHWHIIDQMYKDSIGYEDYLAADCEMILRCDEVHVLVTDGWDKSRGVALEIEYAKMYNKPVLYFTASEAGIKYENRN